MEHPKDIAIAKIETIEQAREWVISLVQDMQFFRSLCDIEIPNPTSKQVTEQRRALWKYLQKQGKVMGALEALLFTRMLNEVAYNELRQQALNSLAPTIVGSV